MTTRSTYLLSFFASLLFHGALVGLLAAAVAAGRLPVAARNGPAGTVTELRISLSSGEALQRGPGQEENPAEHAAPLSGPAPIPSRRSRGAARVSAPPLLVHPLEHASGAAAAPRPAASATTVETAQQPAPAAPPPTERLRRAATTDRESPQDLTVGAVAPGKSGGNETRGIESVTGAERSAVPAASGEAEGRTAAGKGTAPRPGKPGAPGGASPQVPYERHGWQRPAQAAQRGVTGAPSGGVPGGGGGTTHPARLLSPPRPSYPLAARLRGWEGLVVIRLRIDRNGKVFSAAIERSSGHRVLDEAALAAAQHTRFVPASRDDSPVAATVLLPIRFRLDSAGGE